MRRLALVLASGLALGLAPQAGAAPAVPAPTVSVSVVAQGVSLPKNLTKAAWTVDNPGDDGELAIDAITPPGAVTTIDATWTSREIKAFRGLPELTVKGTGTHTGTPSASTPAGVTYGTRWRAAGGAWTRWYDVYRPYAAGSSDGFELTFDYLLPKPPPRVQVQFRLHVELADPSREEQTWQLQAL